MSSYEGMIATDASDDEWRVLLSTGEIRSMSLDALDAAFQEGVVTEVTPLLPPKATVWTRVGIAAGLTPDRQCPDTTRMLPSCDTTGIPAMRGNSVPPVVTAAASRRPAGSPQSMGGTWFVAAIALLVLIGLGFNRAARSASRRSLSAATSTLSTAQALGAQETRGVQETSAVPPPVILTGVVAPPSDARALTPKAEPKHTVVDRAQEKVKAQAPHPARHGRRGKGSSPFVKGGDKFDPLNAEL